MGQSFMDGKNRKWDCAVTVGAVKRVRDLCGVDLMLFFDGDLAEKIARDPVQFCDILFALIQPQAEAAGVTDKDFGESLAGDVLENATVAFLDGLVDFFPSRRQKILKRALAAGMDLQSKQLDLAEKKMDRLLVDMAGQLVSGGESTESPESSASTPTPSPSKS